MIVECDQCRRHFDVPEHALQPDGRHLKCAGCGHVFFQAMPEGEETPSPVKTDEEETTKPSSPVKIMEETTEETTEETMAETTGEASEGTMAETMKETSEEASAEASAENSAADDVPSSEDADLPETFAPEELARLLAQEDPEEWATSFDELREIDVEGDPELNQLLDDDPASADPASAAVAQESPAPVVSEDTPEPEAAEQEEAAAEETPEPEAAEPEEAAAEEMPEPEAEAPEEAAAEEMPEPEAAEPEEAVAEETPEPEAEAPEEASAEEMPEPEAEAPETAGAEETTAEETPSEAAEVEAEVAEAEVAEVELEDVEEAELEEAELEEAELEEAELEEAELEEAELEETELEEAELEEAELEEAELEEAELEEVELEEAELEEAELEEVELEKEYLDEEDLEKVDLEKEYLDEEDLEEVELDEEDLEEVELDEEEDAAADTFPEEETVLASPAERNPPAVMSPKTTSVSPILTKAHPDMEETTFGGEDKEGEKNASKKVWALAAGLLVTLLLGMLSQTEWWISTWFDLRTPYRLISLHSQWHGHKAGNLLFVQGTVGKNGRIMTPPLVQVSLMDGGNNALLTARVVPGRVVDKELLQDVGQQAVREIITLQGQNRTPSEMTWTGKEMAFQAVFMNPPEDAVHFQVDFQ